MSTIQCGFKGGSIWLILEEMIWTKDRRRVMKCNDKNVVRMVMWFGWISLK